MLQSLSSNMAYLYTYTISTCTIMALPGNAFPERDEECDAPATIIKHVLHVGFDGLHSTCFLDAPSGVPNILNRLVATGSYTYNARTALEVRFHIINNDEYQ